MSSQQIKACSKKLALKNPDAAIEFESRLQYAATLAYRANEIRRQAWQMYRDITGAQKRSELPVGHKEMEAELHQLIQQTKANHEAN